MTVDHTAEYPLDWYDGPTLEERRRRRRRNLAIFVSIFVVLAVIAGFLVAVVGTATVRYQNIRAHADSAVEAARQFADDLRDDPQNAEASRKKASDELHAARKEIDKFPMPVLRKSTDVDTNVSIVATILDQFILVVDEAAPTAVKLAQSTSVFKGEDGQSLAERLEALKDAGPALADAPKAMKKLKGARDTLNNVDEAGAWRSVRSQLHKSQDALNDAYDTLESAVPFAS